MTQSRNQEAPELIQQGISSQTSRAPVRSSKTMHLTLHIEAIMRPNDCHNNNKVNLLSVNANHDYARYSRQLILPEFGTEGQSTLENSSVSVVGCGATGSTILNLLARAGIGELTIIDRDFVELTNLQRQVLFDEGDLERR
jgi:hypothetical protein